MSGYRQCDAISDLCPIEASIYGYYPSLPANAFFLAFFALFAIFNLGLGIRHRTWTFMVGVGVGSAVEALGYVGRILLHRNPFSSAGFEIQICCLIMAPAFVSGAIYLTLKHLVLCFGPEQSFLQPRLYTWIFIGFDLLSLILQGAGGGIAATSSGNPSQQKVGNDLMMAGIVWQVITLVIFASMTGTYYFRLSRSSTPLSASAQAMKQDKKFQFFLGGLILAFLAVFIRCVYRIAEMAGGWRNKIMQNEAEFIVLDGVMVAIAVLCLTVFHPGYCFPRLSSAGRRSAESDVEKKMQSDSSLENLAAN